MIYGSWDTECKGESFLSFWAIFLPFDPPNNPKNTNFEKMPEDIIFYTCVPQMTIMMHSLWYFKHDRLVFLSFWAIFCPFTPLTIQKIKILKKWKKLLEILSFTQVYHKWQPYDIWFLRYQLQQKCFSHLWPCFALIPPNSPKNEFFTKLKRSTWRYHHFTQVYQKSWSQAILFLRYGAWQM